jgi:hypothetical protein
MSEKDLPDAGKLAVRTLLSLLVGIKRSAISQVERHLVYHVDNGKCNLRSAMSFERQSGAFSFHCEPHTVLLSLFPDCQGHRRCQMGSLAVVPRSNQSTRRGLQTFG